MDKNGVVAMRLFANWDIDKTSSSVVQRMLNLSINRLILHAFPSQVHSFVITAKLQGHKRTLRSNEIAVLTAAGGGLDIDLDISFTIQYPHFLKRKSNVLQILIQRRRKYKNRPIPGGFKTLAIGLVNLTQLLQQGSLREILFWNTDDLHKQTSSPNVLSIGKLSLTNCQSQPVDLDTGGNKDKALGELTEDSETEDDDEGEQPVDSDHEQTGTSRQRMRESRMRNKLAHRKNLKQKFVALLRKFKVPEEEEEATFPASASASVARAPTAKELEALFEELDDLSDSGPEGIAADEMSIGSNPRPGLQPYFSRELLPGLPAILDDRLSDSEVEPDDWSSDVEAERQRERREEESADKQTVTNVPPMVQPLTHKTSMPADSYNRIHPLGRQSVQPTLSEKLSGSASSASRNLSSLPHSLTAGSIASRGERNQGTTRNASVVETVTSSLPSDPSPSMSSGESIWLCSFSELPPLQTLTTVSSLPIVNCPSTQQVRAAVTQVVSRIQNFCNSNSSPPPITWIGIIGNDRLVSQVVHAYVDVVQHKSSSHWLHCLRFALIVPPISLIGRLLAGVDPLLDHLSRDIWERSADMTVNDLRSLADRLSQWPSGCAGCLHLPIGEALLQMTEREGQSVDSSRLFVPFLAEVRVGQQDEEREGVESTTNSPRERESRDETQTTREGGERVMGGGGQKTHEYPVMQGSPPASPHNRQDTQEMHVEYWLGNNQNNENVCLPPSSSTQTPPNRKEGKGSLKTTFRTLMVSRACAQPLLSLLFVKEKRKEKMLHKLGMKNKKSSEPDNPPVQVGCVSRLLCSGTSKHSKLTVCVDGNLYTDVRFFQTSSQWPTHVRTLPISLLSPTINMHIP